MEYYGWIYCITNLINNKKYIGQTADKKGYKERWRKHRSCLRRGNHKNSHLQNAWNKYGEENFEFILLHEYKYKSKEDVRNKLNDMEKYYIDKWNLFDRDLGYNIASAGSNGNNFAGKSEEEMKEYGKLRSEIAKKWWNNASEEEKEIRKINMIASRKGKNMSKDNPNSKRVAMINKKTNEVIKIFDSVADASEEICNDRNSRNIHICAIGQNKTAWGYKWRYLDEYGKIIFQENDDLILDKKIAMIDKESNEIIKEFDNIFEANEYFGKDKHSSNICSCLRGKTKTAYGYIWKYIYK